MLRPFPLISAADQPLQMFGVSGTLDGDRGKNSTAIRKTEQTACPELGSRIAILRSGGNRMRRIVMICAALFASTLALTASASARLGVAPMATQDNSVIQVRGGHGHGGGHMGRGGRGHHYGWGRGRGHHYGWRHH
jgi:hypothetical protein